MKRAIYILTIIFLTACGSENSNLPNDVVWKITKENPNESFSKDNIYILSSE